MRLKPADFNEMTVVVKIECNARGKVNECVGSTSSSCLPGAMLRVGGKKIIHRRISMCSVAEPLSVLPSPQFFAT